MEIFFGDRFGQDVLQLLLGVVVVGAALFVGLELELNYLDEAFAMMDSKIFI